jgi:hypothetical protein
MYRLVSVLDDNHLLLPLQSLLDLGYFPASGCFDRQVDDGPGRPVVMVIVDGLSCWATLIHFLRLSVEVKLGFLVDPHLYLLAYLEMTGIYRFADDHEWFLNPRQDCNGLCYPWTIQAQSPRRMSLSVRSRARHDAENRRKTVGGANSLYCSVQESLGRASPGGIARMSDADVEVVEVVKVELRV